MANDAKPLSVGVKTCWLLLKSGRFVFATLLGGLVFAYLANAAAIILSFVHAKTTAETLQNVGWIVGVVITIIGIALGRIRTSFFINWDPTRTEKPNAPQTESKPAKEAKGIWGNAGFFALLGLIAGIVVTTVLVMSWFSVSVSPFAPASWSSSVHAVGGAALNSELHTRASGGFTTENPILLRLFWMPSAVLVGIGLIVGAIVGVSDKSPKKESA